MQCENCHAVLEDGAQFCPNCGAAVNNTSFNVEAGVNVAVAADSPDTPVPPVPENPVPSPAPEAVVSSPAVDTGTKKNNIFVILTVVFGMIALISSILAVVSLATKPASTPQTQQPTTTTTPTTSSSEKVNFEGYTLNVPVGYTYEFYTDKEGNKSLNFSNAAGTHVISLQYFKTLTFSAIGEKVGTLAASFGEQIKDSTVKSSHETISGMELHTIDLTTKDNKSSVMYAWAKAGQLYSFMGYLHSTTGASSELLADFAKIMNGVTQQTQVQVFEEKYPDLFKEEFLDLKFDVLTK